MKKILLLLAAVVLSGCSTVPASSDAAKDIPAPIEFQEKAGRTPVTLIRDQGFIASMCAITTFIDGKPLVNLDTGEKVTAYLPTGEVIVGAGFIGKGLCHGAPKKEREFIVKANQPRTLRIFIDQSGNVDILPTTEN